MRLKRGGPGGCLQPYTSNQREHFYSVIPGAGITQVCLSEAASGTEPGQAK